ncbi:MAG TPA: NADH-quinone oxidoreductase subunit J [Thermoguttaceae bacterium]|nr:NADH-quinone oxidoreductase subunit J [Thermoguttaceae bacterium]
MSFDHLPWIHLLAALLSTLGVWLLLPRGNGAARSAGAVLAAAALGLWASQLLDLGHWGTDALFSVLAGMAVLGAIGTVVMRKAVYSAIWFGVSLLGTAGLLLLSGAQFLAVATVVIYAGAILVAFLFVLMLAQPQGRAPYDRTSWEALMSAAAGMILVGVLSMTFARVMTATDETGRPVLATAAEAAGDRAEHVLAEPHVARLGAELFGRHLIAVEVAGVLLLAALVGAAVIAGKKREEQDG